MVGMSQLLRCKSSFVRASCMGRLWHTAVITAVIQIVVGARVLVGLRHTALYIPNTCALFPTSN
jgi:hypothetical protein